jgi:YteA family regulatory protein
MIMKVTDKQTKRLKKQLLSRQTELVERINRDDHNGLELSMFDSLRELSYYDNHPADIGTELFERGKDIALNEQNEHLLDEINNALENMETGTYGVCSMCNKPIPYLRLEAIPWTAYCIKHVPDPSISYRRPVEEEFLAPPFGRTSLDDQGDQTQFDGEDAWQIVESWGNSDSPAMAENPNDSIDYDEMYIEADENVGFVQPIESFLATDLYGNVRMIVRNGEYYKYLENNEGDHTLEVDYEQELDELDNLDDRH